MSERLQTLLSDLQRSASPDAPAPSLRAEHADWLKSATAGEIDQLLDALTHSPPPADRADDPLLAETLSNLQQRFHAQAGGSPSISLPEETGRRMASLYRHLGASCTARRHLLAMLAASTTSENLARFAELTADDPPSGQTEAALTFVPLFQRRDFDPADLFPRLLDGLAHAGVAAPILDLANHLTRRGIASQHPATDRKEHLATLLGGLVRQLQRLQQPPHVADPATGARRGKVAQSIALTVALCDALALIGDRSAVDKLYQAMELNHRQLQTEAAAALARLGEPAGA